MNSAYVSPLSKRYASREMQEIFSDDLKFTTWRRLWVALAEAEQQLGINITDEQIDELRANIDNIDYEMAQQKELQVRHDVMAHVLTYGEALPQGKEHNPLGSNLLLCGRQYGYYHNEKGSLKSQKAPFKRNVSPVRFCREV
jgi:adenylosuccinate lyase